MDAALKLLSRPAVMADGFVSAHMFIVFGFQIAVASFAESRGRCEPIRALLPAAEPEASVDVIRVGFLRFPVICNFPSL